MKQLVIYIHGKGGSVKEAEHYKPFFATDDVIGFDYQAQNPWEAKSEFQDFFHRYRKSYDSIILVANSIGAFFCNECTRKGTGGQSIFHFTNC